jgi:hypothetical protein
MSIENLRNISEYLEKKKNLSDFKDINQLLYNLNFTKTKFKKKQNGGFKKKLIPLKKNFNLKGGTGTGDNNPNMMGSPGMMDQENMMNQQGMMDQENMMNQQGMMNAPGMMNQQGMMNAPGMMDQENMMNQQGMMNAPGMMDQENMMNQQGMMGAPGMMSPENMMNQQGMMGTPGMMGPENMMNQQGMMSPPGMMGAPNTVTNIEIGANRSDKGQPENPGFATNDLHTYTIPEGTILYASSYEEKGFNTKNIKLQDGLTFYSPNFRLAVDRISGCAITKEGNTGYVHRFRVKAPIPNIYIQRPCDLTVKTSMEELQTKICGEFYGIGFFYDVNSIEEFSPGIQSKNDQSYSEFALCNSSPYLEYISSQGCECIRKLSQPYKI